MKLFLLLLFFVVNGCNAFKYGATESKSLNSYYLVTGNENNFGDKRMYYNEHFHNCTCFKDFLNSRGMPSFIYEYKNEAKIKGIKLFYPSIDSVFVFEEQQKGKRYSFIKENRKMSEDEKITFQKLKSSPF